MSTVSDQSNLAGSNMANCLIVVPVLNRPESVAPLLMSATADERAKPLFVPSRDDTAELDALRAAGATYAIHPSSRTETGQWARKIDWAFKEFAIPLGFEWVLFGADDLAFHPGWFEACLQMHSRTGACVIGTNDMGNPRVKAGTHSTHPLVHRDYLECGTADEDGVLLHFGYTHSFADDEFVQTAMVRGTWTFARTAYVEHRHPHWGKGVDDDTYRLGMVGFNEDRALYERRKWLWLS